MENKKLVLRELPAFDYLPSHAALFFGRLICSRQEKPGNYDLCIYEDGRLCLSAHDYFKGERGKHDKDSCLVKRARRLLGADKPILRGSLSPKILTRTFRPILEKLLDESNEQVIAIINNSNIYSSRNLPKNFFEYNNQFTLTGSPKLIVMGRHELMSIFDSYWARKFPKGVYSNPANGSNFNIYFFDGKHEDDFKKLVMLMPSDSKGVTETMQSLSALTISNPSYGYKLRANKQLNIKPQLIG